MKPKPKIKHYVEANEMFLFLQEIMLPFKQQTVRWHSVWSKFPPFSHWFNTESNSYIHLLKLFQHRNVSKIAKLLGQYCYLSSDP